MTLLSLGDLSVTLRNRLVLDRVSLTVKPGEFIGLLGANGAGKSTLLRAALALLPSSGRNSLAALTPSQRARTAAWLPQAREVAWPVSVESLVTLGRLPHLQRGVRPRREDLAAIDIAIARMELGDLRGRTVPRLSGGEQARVLIARALAQDTPLLLADEPIAGLDPGNQISTMEVFAALASEGKGVIASLHDIGLAARHCTRVVVLHDHSIAADGPPAEALTAELLRKVFRISAFHVETDEGPVFQPLKVLK